MEISEDKLDERSLLGLAEQAIGFLCARDFESLTQRFPYAVACGRPPAAAVAADLARTLRELPSLEASLQTQNARYKVGYFEANDVTLHAEIQCRFTAPSGDTLEVDFVVIGHGAMGMALETIAAFPANPAP
jgi:hypothetical protein